jgi:hypothetical protein
MDFTPIAGKLEIDHINKNRLDNRKKNLRFCTRSENLYNKTTNKNNTSGYKGVVWDNQRRKWCASISIERRRINLGFFQNKEEAAKVYNEAALKYHGEFASVNDISKIFKEG